MKKLFVLIIITLLSYMSFAQGGFTRPNTSYGTHQYRISLDSTFFYPTGCGAASLRSSDLHQSALYYDSCAHRTYVYDPSTTSWSLLASSPTWQDVLQPPLGNELTQSNYVTGDHFAYSMENFDSVMLRRGSNTFSNIPGFIDPYILISKDGINARYQLYNGTRYFNNRVKLDSLGIELSSADSFTNHKLYVKRDSIYLSQPAPDGDSSNKVATTGDIKRALSSIGGSQSLQGVTDNGAVTDHDIKVNSISTYNAPNNDYTKISSYDQNIRITQPSSTGGGVFDWAYPSSSGFHTFVVPDPPSGAGTLTLSVNGIDADVTGNVLLPIDTANVYNHDGIITSANRRININHNSIHFDSATVFAVSGIATQLNTSTTTVSGTLNASSTLAVSGESYFSNIIHANQETDLNSTVKMTALTAGASTDSALTVNTSTGRVYYRAFPITSFVAGLDIAIDYTDPLYPIINGTFANSPGSGTNVDGTMVNLGGTLTADADVDGQGYNFYFHSANTGFKTNYTDGITETGDVNGNSNITLVRVDDNNKTVTATNGNSDIKFGVNTASPSETFEVNGTSKFNGANKFNYKIIATGNYEVAPEDWFISVNTVAAGSGVSIALPPVSSSLGRVLKIKRLDNLSIGSITLIPDGTDLIQNSTNGLMSLNVDLGDWGNPDQSYSIIATSTGWEIY